ncbi:peptidylprolyl isomerase [Psychrobacillus sp. FSL K6-4615]|uniref:peptidylprolyl isomerase n=1 Tax=Psychrobacillus TaxID=1221880 RepID=UPI0030F986A0
MLKKIVVLGILVLFILSACNSSTMSIKEIENVPKDLQEYVNSSLRLQSINDGEKGYYIIFHSTGEVEAYLETQGDKLNIMFNETNLKDEVIKQNTYYVTTGPEHEMIDVLVNGESIPFDNMTVQ